MAKRCLVLSCSRAKRRDSGLLPALERYDGPLFRVLRKYLRLNPEAQLSILILSARFGLITAGTPIPYYDQRMTFLRAQELRIPVQCALTEKVTGCSEVVLILGKPYRAVLDGWSVPDGIRVRWLEGSLGERLSRLRAWLYNGREAARQQQAGRDVPTSGAKGYVRFRGRVLRMSVEEVYRRIEEALGQGKPKAAFAYRTWYVPVKGYKVSPKWVMHVLTGLPVRTFGAQEARRALQALGVTVKAVWEEKASV